MREHGTAVAPGDTFGPGGAGLVRISLAAAPDTIVEGIRRDRRGGAGRRLLCEPTTFHARAVQSQAGCRQLWPKPLRASAWMFKMALVPKRVRQVSPWEAN